MSHVMELSAQIWGSEAKSSGNSSCSIFLQHLYFAISHGVSFWKGVTSQMQCSYSTSMRSRESSDLVSASRHPCTCSYSIPFAAYFRQSLSPRISLPKTGLRLPGRSPSSMRRRECLWWDIWLVLSLHIYIQYDACDCSTFLKKKLRAMV